MAGQPQAVKKEPCQFVEVTFPANSFTGGNVKITSTFEIVAPTICILPATLEVGLNPLKVMTGEINVKKVCPPVAVVPPQDGKVVLK